jgi:hypothetical protein
MLVQIVSVLGAALILGAYVALQMAWLPRTARMYNLMNLLGACLLLFVAVADRRIGFVVLELVWALVSIPPLLRGRPDGPASPSAA